MALRLNKGGFLIITNKASLSVGCEEFIILYRVFKKNFVVFKEISIRAGLLLVVQKTASH